MRLSLSLLFVTLVTSSVASPLVLDYSESTIQKLKGRRSAAIKASTQKRQSAGTTANEFLEGECRDVIFIYARGSTQDGNIVSHFSSLAARHIFVNHLAHLNRERTQVRKL